MRLLQIFSGSFGLRRLIALLCALVILGSAATSYADARADARRYFNRGMRAIAEGRLEEGVELLLSAYEIRPHPNVLFNVARAYTRLGDLESAIAKYEEYLSSDPRDAETVRGHVEELKTRLALRRMVDEGLAAIAQGRHLEGISLLKRAYEQRPHPNLLYNIARAYEQAGEYAAAIDYYKSYLATGPGDATEVDKTIQRLEKEAEKRPLARKAPEAPSGGATADPNEIAEIVVRLLAERGALAPAPALAAPTTSLSMSSTGAESLEAKAGAGYEDVVVTASRREQSPLDAPNAVTILTDEDIRLSGARSIPDLLRRVPGMDVMAMSNSDWNVSMRGFNRRLANKILVLVDGRTVYQDFLGATIWNGLSIDLSDIERVEVVRGPGSAIYGAYAYTGIINIITKSPDQIDGSVLQLAGGNGDAIRGNYQFGKRHGRVAARASIGYERSDKYDLEFDPERPDFTTNVELDPEVSVDRVRGDGQVEYRLPEGAKVFAGAGAHRGGTEIYGVSALRNQHVNGLISNVRGGYSSDFFSLLVFWDRIRADSQPQFFASGTPDLASEVRADLIAIEPVLRPTFTLLGEHALVLGAEFRHKFIDWNYIDESHEEDFFALFAQDEWRASEKWTFLVSGRLDRHPLIGFLGSPRLAVIFKPGAGHAVRLSAGTAFRQPTQSETYLSLTLPGVSGVSGIGATLVGSRDLEAENIATVDLGYLNQAEYGEFEIVAYTNRVSNLIVRGEPTLTPPTEGVDPNLGGFVGAETLYTNNPDVFLAVGGEASARVYPADGVDIGASYALQYIVDTDTDERFEESPVHKATLWGQLRTKMGLDFGLSLHFVSDQLWLEEVVTPAGLVRQELPVDAYLVINSRVGYRMLDDQLEIGVSGSNLSDIGDARHREHPLANRVESRVLATLIARF